MVDSLQDKIYSEMSAHGYSSSTLWGTIVLNETKVLLNYWSPLICCLSRNHSWAYELVRVHVGLVHGVAPAGAELQPLARTAKELLVQMGVRQRGTKGPIKTSNDLGTRIKLQISPIHLVENMCAMYLITYARTDGSIPWMNCCKF
jgi:hypothetical protein